jgi:DNA-binding transcriptional LysR family regulator
MGGALEVPDGLRAEAVRQEPTLVAMAATHPLAAHEAVPVAALADVELLLPSDDAAGEWNEFVVAFCDRAGVVPQRFEGFTHGSVAAAEVAREGQCVIPTMAWTDPPKGLEFRPLVEPEPLFTWLVIWRQGNQRRPEVAAFLETARTVRKERKWPI